MYKAGLGKVVSRTEKAPEAPADSTETAAAAFEKNKLTFQEKNGKLYTRLYLATSDCPDGFSSIAPQVVQSFDRAYFHICVPTALSKCMLLP